MGNLQYEEVLEEIAKAHVVVLPSFGRSFANGKALVTSDIGWAKEVMIDGETGFTVDPKNFQEYVSKILQLLMEPALEKNGKGCQGAGNKKIFNGGGGGGEYSVL